ncbi:uncharacterized protein EDB91DRAFT_1335706 [Suillus paluster]|uniref:uncharacterized protein n=1 Tax=Suillus paluster TaxID=48578 RepID=UPI001B877A63|nr:uncharacterized protein EDB91DRAFT_1335706 [Suillus paluster]KAG1744147.1 hypothetical protein EDB91DRAFT_1335706 [Suillus paluster]
MSAVSLMPRWPGRGARKNSSEHHAHVAPVIGLSYHKCGQVLDEPRQCLIQCLLRQSHSVGKLSEKSGTDWRRTTIGKYLDKDRTGDAQPLVKLAVRIFSLVPISMADERTGSTFTWVNSPLRSRQQVNHQQGFGTL